MKKILTFIFVIASFAFQAIAQDSKTDTSSQGIKLEIAQYNEPSVRHRAPKRVSIMAWYNAQSNSIDISYNGLADGEVYLYMNGDIIGYDSIINTSLPLPSDRGLFQIEIVSDTWTAYGLLQL